VDVAGMLRSFDYAAQAALMRQREEDAELLTPWAARWVSVISAAFLDGYLEAVRDASFIPPAPGDFRLLLDVLLLDKAVYEIGYELSYRPEFVQIPLRAVARLLGASPP